MSRLFMLMRSIDHKALVFLIKSCAAVILAGLAFFCSVGYAAAAVPARGFDPDTHLPERGDVPAEAISALSGSSYPGVVDCLFLRPSENENGPGPRADVHIKYPSFGNKQVDDDIRDWVSDMADAFINHLNIADIQLPSTPDNLDSVIDSFLDNEEQPNDGGRFELWGAYKVSRPSNAAVSIAFELWNYTGDREASMDIITLNYSLLTGQRLDLVDIFEKPDIALELMSSWARKQLESRLGAARRSRMLMDGTEPLIENFSSLTLTPEGICINFQPWQVAPRDAGIQRVVMPLKELLPSAPLLALWGKGENCDERID